MGLDDTSLAHVEAAFEIARAQKRDKALPALLHPCGSAAELFPPPLVALVEKARQQLIRLEFDEEILDALSADLKVLSGLRAEANQSTVDLNFALEDAKTEPERLAVEQKLIEVAERLDEYEPQVEVLDDRLEKWRKAVFEQQAAHLCSLLELFMCDLLIWALGTAGRKLTRQKENYGKHTFEVVREPGANAVELAKQSRKAIHRRHPISFQSDSRVREMYEWHFPFDCAFDAEMKERLSTCLSAAAEFDVRYLVHDIRLLKEMRNRIVHSGGEKTGDRYRQIYQACRNTNLHQSVSKSDDPPEPYVILDSDSVSIPGLDKTRELYVSLIRYALRWCWDLCRINTSSHDLPEKKKAFGRLDYFQQWYP